MVVAKKIRLQIVHLYRVIPVEEPPGIIVVDGLSVFSASMRSLFMGE
jgi:hypothetical protein